VWVLLRGHLDDGLQQTQLQRGGVLGHHLGGRATVAMSPKVDSMGNSQAVTACTGRPREDASRAAHRSAASDPADPSTPTTIPPP
jgi:hypothetical protein